MEPLASEFDIFIGKLEDKASKALEKFSRGEALEVDTVSVRLEKLEIDCLVLAEQLDNAIRKVLHDDDRDVLACVLGSPYVRLARMRYLLDTMAFSKNRELDRRWVAFRKSCDTVESVLRDLGGFRTWQELKKAGTFESAFEDPDVDSEDSDSGDEEVEVPDADVHMGSKDALNTDSQNRLVDEVQVADSEEKIGSFAGDSHNNLDDRSMQAGDQETSQVGSQNQEGDGVRDAACEGPIHAHSQDQAGDKVQEAENGEVLVATNFQDKAGDQLRPAMGQETSQIDSQSQIGRINSQRPDLHGEATDQRQPAGGQETTQIAEPGCEEEAPKVDVSHEVSASTGETDMAALRSERSVAIGSPRMQTDGHGESSGGVNVENAEANGYAPAQSSSLSASGGGAFDSFRTAQSRSESEDEERQAAESDFADDIRPQAQSQQQDQSDMDYFEGLRAGPRVYYRISGQSSESFSKDPVKSPNSFQLQSESHQPMRFAAHPRGKNATIDGCELKRASPHKNFVEGIIADVKKAAQNRQKQIDHRDISGGWHGGASAISAVPLWVYPSIGQYAELQIGKIQRYRGQLGMGCVGIGVTQNEPSTLSYMTFPKKLTKLPGPTWLFTGPYHGRTRRFYVNGKMTSRYRCDTNWHSGDRVGILVDLSGVLHLYVNGQNIVSKLGPGMDKLNLHKQKLFLVAEAYGCVTKLLLEPNPDPRSLKLCEDRQSEEDDVIRTTLSDFLREDGPGEQGDASD